MAYQGGQGKMCSLIITASCGSSESLKTTHTMGTPVLNYREFFAAGEPRSLDPKTVLLRDSGHSDHGHAK